MFPNSPNPPPPTCPICYKKPPAGRFTCGGQCMDEWFSRGTGSKALQGYGMRPDHEVVHKDRYGRPLGGPNARRH